MSKRDSFNITETEKGVLSIINVISKRLPRQFTIPLAENLLSKINSKYYDQRVCRFFFKKYFNINIGKYSYGTPQLLKSNLTLFKSIGSFCSIALGLTILNGNHPLTRLTTHPTTFDKRWGFVTNNTRSIDLHPKNTYITIGNDVWIGANVTILSSINIADGAVIGAGSVISKDVAPFSIVGGVPAKHIKYRFNNDTINYILKSKWWDMSDDEIREIYNDLHYSNPENINFSYNEEIKKNICKKLGVVYDSI